MLAWDEKHGERGRERREERGRGEERRRREEERRREERVYARGKKKKLKGEAKEKKKVM